MGRLGLFVRVVEEQSRNVVIAKEGLVKLQLVGGGTANYSCHAWV